MDESIKKSFAEIRELVKTLPEGLQLRAFEILLQHELGTASRAESSTEKTPPVPPEKVDGVLPPSSGGGDDLVLADVHVKARKFLEKNDLSIDHLNELFYKEGAELKPLFEDLNTTKLSESQIRIALLASLKSGIQSGEFEFDGEDVRQQCQTKKCYDAANFATNFKNRASLFDGLKSYEKDSPKVRLSEQGKKALADLIKELQ
jgi:hypothetical protein